MKRVLTLLVVIGSILFPAEMFSWSMTGHRVIAEIAQQNIKSKTNREISRLLDGLPMAYWVNWPDFIKSDKTGEWEDTYIWHYVNAPGNLSESDFIEYIRNIQQENLYSEIPKLVNALGNKNLSDDERRTALVFFIHLLGDAHQPMHVGREEDMGGNKISLFWFNSPTNLHAVWDGKLIDYEKYSYTEYAGILNIMPDAERKALRRGSLEEWLYESHQLANDLYDNINDGDNLMYDYSYKYKYTTELQLQRAGLRLAAVLDMVLR